MSYSNWMIYGCNGYTGQLIAEHAVNSGLQPTLAGRNEAEVKRLADRLNLPYRIFSLTNQATIEQNISDYGLVLHCAGPFAYTALPMAKACIATGCHYLDITGEYHVFESIYKLDEDAKKRGVMLMPGVGFDVVPSDCLVKHLAETLPQTESIEIALLQKGGRLSHGTAITVADNMGLPTMIRKQHKLVPTAPGDLVREIKFPDKSRLAVAISWGDIASGYRSTKVPNITVYNCLPKKVIDGMRTSRYFGFVFQWGWVKKLMISGIKKRPAGPSDEERKNAQSIIWGEAKNALGISKRVLLEMPEGYTITYLTATEIAKRVMEGQFKAGAQTPTLVYGKDFILSFKGVTLKDLK